MFLIIITYLYIVSVHSLNLESENFLLDTSGSIQISTIKLVHCGNKIKIPIDII